MWYGVWLTLPLYFFFPVGNPEQALASVRSSKDNLTLAQNKLS